VNNDSLRLIENDTLRWRTWSESTVDGKRYVTIAMMNPNVLNAYTLQQDTSNHKMTLYSTAPNGKDSVVFNYTDEDANHRTLTGIMKQTKIQIGLLKVKPDSSLHLLKSKRIIITFDDETGNE
jgi:hypothetical protein